MGQKDPFSIIDDGHLKIRTKKAERQSLIPNKAQRYVLSIIRDLWNKDKPIRLFILKARQLGMSTLIEAILYAITSQHENLNADIIADEQKRSDNLFEISKFYQETCPSHLRPEIKKSNAKKLEFEKLHSQIIVETSGDKDAGRSFTFQLVHLSEWARFKNVNEIHTGLLHTVPPLPHTIVIKESTANGFNHAYTEWQEAVAEETDFVPIFIPWYWSEDYKMPVSEGFAVGDANFSKGGRSYAYITKAELSLQKLMWKEKITDIKERLEWRRWDIINTCKGDLLKFNEDNPSTPEEAFVSSGNCAFDKEQLDIQLRQKKKPIAVANIVKVDYKFEVRLTTQGDFKFWEKIKPRIEEEYIVSGDACSGSGTDYAWLVARAKRTNSIAVTYRAKCDPDELEEKAYLLASFLHQAEAAIENDKYGFHTNLKLRGRYGNIFVQESIDKEKKTVSTKFGWDTNSKSRPSMLGQMKEEIRQGALELNDPDLIRECLTFIKNPDTKKEEAQEGCCDDGVISCAIGGAVRQLHPYKPIEMEVKRTEKVIPDY